MNDFRIKICLFVTVVFSFLVLFIDVYSQFSQIPVRFTYGDDRNPTFQIRNDGYSISRINNEFLAYERHNGSASNILVSRINTSGAADSGVFITNNAYENVNPSIGYYYLYPNSEIINSLVVWETNKNGNKDVYARIYKQSQGWLNEFPVDTTSGIQKDARVAIINQNTYAIVYNSSDDIQVKIINIDNQNIIIDTIVTTGINEICRNPYVVYTQDNPKKLIITFERRFSENQNSIYCLKSDSIMNIMNFGIDTVRYTGVNYNSGFTQFGTYPVNCICVYETKLNGKRNVYGTHIKWNGQSSVHYNIIVSPYFDMWSYKGSDFMIGDNLTNGTYGYITNSNNSVYVKTRMGSFWPDSISVLVSNDTNYYSKLTVSSANTIPSSACWRIWYAFERRTGATGIYGISFTSCAMNIKKLTETADDFLLEQNYPNPFNPSTKIRFDVMRSPTGFHPSGRKERAFGDDNMVVIKVYDVQGREVQTLVNERMNVGTYEVDFDGRGFNSGVYFYQMRVGNFRETRSMVLLK